MTGEWSPCVSDRSGASVQYIQGLKRAAETLTRYCKYSDGGVNYDNASAKKLNADKKRKIFG